MPLHPALIGAATALGLSTLFIGLRRHHRLRAQVAELERRVQAQDAQRRGLLAQMHAAQRTAERSDQAKTRFVASASHDLRQPAHALGLYLAALREGGMSIGICGLVKRDGLEDVDVGFAFLQPYWSQGYATESAAAVLADGRERLRLPRIRSEEVV